MKERGGRGGREGGEGGEGGEGARLVVAGRLGPLYGRIVHQRLERDLVRVEDQPVTIGDSGCNHI